MNSAIGDGLRNSDDRKGLKDFKPQPPDASFEIVTACQTAMINTVEKPA